MTILYLLRDFPKISSETFILNEIAELKKLGHDIWILTDYQAKISKKDVHEKYLKYNLSNKVIATIKYSRGFFKLIDFIKKLFLNILFKPGQCLKELKIVFSNKKEIINKNFWEKLDSYLAAQSLKKYNLKIDIVYCPFAHYHKVNTGLDIAQINKAPFLCAFRALELYSQDNRENILKNIDNFKKSRAFVVISKKNKKEIEKVFGLNIPIEIIHSAVDTEIFKKSQKWQKSEKLKIISIARFVEKKGIEYLLEALFILKNLNFKFTLKLVGKGLLEEKYIKLIKKYNLNDCVLIVKPKKHELIKLMIERSDIMILPCLVAKNGDRDILPNVIKEAMALEKPIITSKISGIEELIEENKNGFLVPEKNSQALAEKIKNIYNLSELELLKIGQEARKKIVRDFNIQTETKKLEKLFMSQIRTD